MKKIPATLFAVIAWMVLPSPCFASSSIVAHVINFGTYGNGNVYVAFDQSIDEAGCPQTSIELPATSSANKAILAVAALAQATGKTIQVHTDICFNGSPSLDPNARASFLISQPN